ncbi:beta-lactamase superfamily II metal-dependent hydrolase [Bradyrhizobium sp. USDA 3311]|uniref:MBL fold metallo-hydrolase n=1 Tax=Bradyrhizobium sp. LCT2 TaxID=2493093 RepID=UPI0013740DED|nr:MBL fold metallo-hydrolase [Bradyrhizobium sp. LCT2]QHP72950.1 MBL fold metallo-hydrolase [Bradyrhizobium sp. LCT2]
MLSARKTAAKRKTAKKTAYKKQARKRGAPSAPSPEAGLDSAADAVSDATPARAKPGHISVRMYNNILGDCFLIRVPVGPERDVKILIDCGALQGMPSAADIMNEIAADLARTTGSHLDVLVVTHEHWDHLSGFCQAETIFRKFEIDELWLAWTENDKDADAARIRARRQKALQLLLTLDKHFGPAAAAPDEDDEEAATAQRRAGQRDEVRELLAFTGQSPGAAASRMDTGAILTMLKGLAKKVRYFTPGADPIPLRAGIPVEAYILGPPKDTKFLLRSNPRKGEVYLTDESAGLGVYLAAAVQLEKEAIALDADEARAIELSMPFDNQHFRRLSEVEREQNQPYFSEREEWRRIDRDWLGAAEQLALKLDSDTNNTSLVLAFAFGSKTDPRVLLFPGDAQVGNWESWQQYVWPSGAKREDPAAIDIQKLLAATVLYKVGHHASHNATLRANGLELMTHPDLVAMIPVREEFARKTKHWNMPFPSLLARLLERTKGRVLRADKSLDDLHADRDHRQDKPGELSRDDWESFFARVSAGPKSAHSDAAPLYVEYSIPLA